MSFQSELFYTDSGKRLAQSFMGAFCPLKRPNLYAARPPGRKQKWLGVFMRLGAKGAYDEYGGEFRPTPEHQELHKAIDERIRYEQARGIAKTIGRRLSNKRATFRS
jgi:hypothetical protein